MYCINLKFNDSLKALLTRLVIVKDQYSHLVYTVSQNTCMLLQMEPFSQCFVLSLLSIARYQVSFHADIYVEKLPIVSSAFNIMVCGLLVRQYQRVL